MIIITGHKADTCAECWVYSDTMLIDCGMFGEKEICYDCYERYYYPRPILEKGELRVYGLRKE